MDGILLRVSCIFVADGAKIGLQGEDGAPAGQTNSLGGILGCKMAFYALFPRRKAQGCGGQDSGDGGHGQKVFF